jgi:hypothetical protein
VNRLYRSRFSTSVLVWLSLVVVLALAVVSAGAVVRSHDLKGRRAEVSRLEQQVQALQTHGAALQTQIDAGIAFAHGVEPLAVAGRLSGQPVVVIVAPNAPKNVVDATVQGLADAGATLTGVIDVRPSFVDPSQVATLGGLATSLGATAPSQNVPAQASALLASALVGQPAVTASSSAGGTLDAASTETLAGLAQGGFIAVAQAPTQHARLAVIVAPTPAAPPSSPTATASRNALVSLVAAFPGAGGTTVVAGASGSAADGGLLAVLRAGGTSGAGTAAVSTVDDADGPAGTVAVIMALQAELAQPGSAAAVGHYGNGPGARAVLPAPPPS